MTRPDAHALPYGTRDGGRASAAQPQSGRPAASLVAATAVIETPRLTLRRPEARDLEGYIAFMATDRSSGVGGPKSRSDAWRSFAGLLGHWELRGFGQFALVAHGDDRAFGLCGPLYPEGWPEGEIGWSIWAADREGCGLALEAAQAARAHAYDRLGWTGAVSYMRPDNLRSAALAERLGAQRDRDAATPPVDGPVIVYRHPRPGADA